MVKKSTECQMRPFGNIRDRDDEHHASFAHTKTRFEVKFPFVRLTVLLVDEAGNDNGVVVSGRELSLRQTATTETMQSGTSLTSSTQHADQAPLGNL